MSKEQKDEMKKNGFIILELWQFFMWIAAAIAIGAIFWYSTTTTLAQHAEKIRGIETWEATHDQEQRESVSYRNRKLDEIIFNQRAICKKLNITYEVLEGEQK